MNPPTPTPTPSLLPPPPYPSSSSYSFHLPNPPQISNPNPNFFRPNYPPPPPDLSSTLSTLKTLIQLSESTILSISSAFPTAVATAEVTCPFNFNHRVPPESLFSHTLRCTSSPCPVSVSTSDFYYQDCPAVVALPLVKRSSITESSFTLPNFLLDFIGDSKKAFSTSSEIRFLPSEILFVKRETEGWRDYPTHYSRIVQRVILCVCSSLCEKDFVDVISSWIVINSPRYGVVIDVPVKDHIILLFRLSLRAITSEAVDLVDRDMSEFYLKCPVLNEGLMWYGAQLSILYGEINGKLFAIHMLKQLILNAMTKLLLFSQQPVISSMDNLVNDENISVSQVATGVAAIYQRSLLEEQIKAIRYSRQLNSSQRVAEHEYISKRAEEERSQRSDYRPIIEHDLFSWQRTRNQETNVMKSREELLAEERDYKRRRMSYRGKKMKRTTTQVMRDIIEEYMGEIKAAGGGDVADEAGKITSESFPVCNASADYVMENEPFNSSEIGSAPPNDRKHLISYEINRSSRINDRSPKDFEQSKRNQRVDRNYYSESSEKRNNSRAHEQSSARGHRDATEAHRKFSRRSLERNYTSSREGSSHRRDRFDKKSEDNTRHTRNLNRSHRSDSNPHVKFEDRYNPSESCEISDDL